MANSSETAETYAFIEELIRIGRLAVLDAQSESRRMGVPNVYTIQGTIYYETPDGQLSLSDPFLGSRRDP